MTNATITTAIGTAKRLIEKFGAQVAWSQYVDGTLPDPTKPEEPGPRTVKNYVARVVFTKEKRLNFEFLKFLKQTDVIGSDQSFLLAGDCGFVPTKDDSFVYGGKSYTMEKLTPVRPDGRVVLWIGRLKA